MLILISFSFSFAEAESPDYWRVKGVVLNGVLWMHTKPSYLSKAIGHIPYNATCLKKLECTEDITLAKYKKLSPKEQNRLKYQTKWCKIIYHDIVGWVNGNYLRKNGNYLRKSRKCPQKTPRR